MTKCVICKEVIQPNWHGWKGGHNAQPVAEGRCCEICNDVHVLPRRIYNLGRMFNGKDNKKAT